MFTGEYKHSIDSKNRLSIPSKFREQLGESFFITKGLDNCLFAFSNDEWRLFEQKLSQLPISNKSSRAFARAFLSGAVEVKIDKSGRALIPQYLVEFAKLRKDISVNGAGSRIEIWDAESWHKYSADVSNNMDELSEGMESLGIRF